MLFPSQNKTGVGNRIQRNGFFLNAAEKQQLSGVTHGHLQGGSAWNTASSIDLINYVQSSWMDLYKALEICPDFP